ncbi:MAG: universal stress protein [Bacteroidetes bacterium]|nr:universal stress protein [Bacteroidota bacterium]MBU2584007.1 universal stress protein [Bacteroidota bacterium]
MEPKVDKILVPIDFSENSKNAIKYAVAYAEKFKAEIVFVYVIEPVIYPSDFGLGQVPINRMDMEIHSKAEDELKKIIETHLPKGIKGTHCVRTGKPFLEIINCAKENKSDLIILSTHGHSGIEHILFGSTAEKVVRKSPIPVLTIRDTNTKFILP